MAAGTFKDPWSLVLPDTELTFRTEEQALPEGGVPVLALLEDEGHRWWAVVYFCGTRWWYDRPAEGFTGYDTQKVYDHEVVDFSLPPRVEVVGWVELPSFPDAKAGADPDN